MVHPSGVERLEGPGLESEIHSTPSTPVATPELESSKLGSNSKLEELTGRARVPARRPLVRSSSMSSIDSTGSDKPSISPTKRPASSNRLPVRRHTTSSQRESLNSLESETESDSAPLGEKFDPMHTRPAESPVPSEAPPLPAKVTPPVSPSTTPSIESGPPPKYPSAFAPEHSMQPGRLPEFGGPPPPYGPPVAPPQRSRFLDMVPTFIGWGEQLGSIGISLVTSWLNLMEKAADAVVQLSKGRG